MTYATCPKVSYSLFGVVVHYGYSAHSGHYISYIKSMNGQWYCMDDSCVKQVSLQTVLSKNAYLLFYTRNEPKIPYQSPLISSYNNSNMPDKDAKKVQLALGEIKRKSNTNSNAKMDQNHQQNPKNGKIPKLNQRNGHANVQGTVTNGLSATHVVEASSSSHSSGITPSKSRKRALTDGVKDERETLICNSSKKRRVTTEVRNDSQDELLKQFLEENEQDINNNTWDSYNSTLPLSTQRQDSIWSVLSDSSTTNNGDGTDSCTTVESQTQHQSHREKSKASSTEMECCNINKPEIQIFLNGNDAKDSNVWGVNINLDNRIQDQQQQMQQHLQTQMQEFVPVKNEWDQQLDVGLIPGKKQNSKKSSTKMG